MADVLAVVGDDDDAVVYFVPLIYRLVAAADVLVAAVAPAFVDDDVSPSSVLSTPNWYASTGCWSS